MHLKFDKIDRQILTLLEDNGRLTNLDLAEQIGLSPTPCQKRVKRLTEMGAISRYRAVISGRAIGLKLTAFTQVSISPHRKEQAHQFREFVRARNEIVSCHTVSGSADFLLEILAVDMDDYIAFIEGQLMGLPFIANVESNFSMSCIKSSGPISKLIPLNN